MTAIFVDEEPGGPGWAESQTLQLRGENDRFRRQGPLRQAAGDGRWVFTALAASLPQALAIAAIQEGAGGSSPSLDPDGEHRAGVVKVCGERLAWVLDCYIDHTCEALAGDPLQGCYRVLTVMHEKERIR